jgi:DNA-binding NarL/FixJ family response regulator
MTIERTPLPIEAGVLVGAQHRRRCVVLCDSENVVGMFVDRWLKELGLDCEVVHCVDGDEAWRELNKSQTDLFVTDWHHAGMDGIEILNRLAKLHVRFPVLMLGQEHWPKFEELFRPNLNLRYLEMQPDLHAKFLETLVSQRISALN